MKQIAGRWSAIPTGCGASPSRYRNLPGNFVTYQCPCSNVKTPDDPYRHQTILRLGDDGVEKAACYKKRYGICP